MQCCSCSRFLPETPALRGADGKVTESTMARPDLHKSMRYVRASRPLLDLKERHIYPVRTKAFAIVCPVFTYVASAEIP